MRDDVLRPGTVIHYSYLWRWQQERGETEGRKDRPVCLAIAVRSRRDDLTHLALLAISGTPPRPEQTTVEVPEMECRRAGLGDWKRAWITVSEYNYDIAERSYYFDLGQEPMGRFSRNFMVRLATTFAPFFRSGTARVDRTE